MALRAMAAGCGQVSEALRSGGGRDQQHRGSPAFQGSVHPAVLPEPHAVSARLPGLLLR